ncbi:transcobalamin 2, isoform CRA_b [Mus musculus]|nr:transcobalamin 2, isoform CRA_b [Mus musculus]
MELLKALLLLSGVFGALAEFCVIPRIDSQLLLRTLSTSQKSSASR